MTTAADIAGEKTIIVTTFRRNGEGVSTPVWINPVSDGRIGFWTAMGSGTTKRLAHNKRITLQAGTTNGKPKPGAAIHSGTAEMIQSGPLFDEVQAAGRKKYGAMVPITKALGRVFGQRKKGQVYGDTVVLVTLDGCAA
jgi:PPOX class probable F420-dependent enzyme